MISAAVHACRLLPLLNPVFCFLHAGSGFTWFHSNWADKSAVTRIELSLICLGIRGSSVLHFLLFIHQCVTWGHTLPKHTDLFKRQPCRGRHANTRYPVNRPTLSHFRSKRNICFFLSKPLTENKNSTPCMWCRKHFFIDRGFYSFAFCSISWKFCGHNQPVLLSLLLL